MALRFLFNFDKCSITKILIANLNIIKRIISTLTRLNKYTIMNQQAMCIKSFSLQGK